MSMRGGPVYFLALSLRSQNRLTENNIVKLLDIAYAHGKHDMKNEIIKAVYDSQNTEWIPLMPQHYDTAKEFE